MLRHPKEWSAWVGIGLSAVAGLIAVVFWLVTQLENKADAALEDRVVAVETNIKWIRATLTGIAQKLDVPLPPQDP